MGVYNFFSVKKTNRRFSRVSAAASMEAIRRPLARSSVVALFFVLLTGGAFICTRYCDSTSSAALLAGNSSQDSVVNTTIVSSESNMQNASPKPIQIPLNCSLGNLPRTCPANYYPAKIPAETMNLSPTPPPTCPDYFRWIHEDLFPWRETGITREMVMSAKRTANFRLVILNGKAYVQSYTKSFQSRDTFTLWGILQMLRRYPGKLPDLDLMFDCADRPVMKKQFFNTQKNPVPPPLFRYCADDNTYVIVFPDWSFWGWPEIAIKPWEALSKELIEGNKKARWTEREPHAFWKGNPTVAKKRMDLLKCNVSEKQDWGARIYAQDWFKEQQQGYKQSNLADQCMNRYKIYIEGSAWSVSEKYILACDSLTLLVVPRYYDFFTRGLVPLKHYWPIKEEDKCRSIKHAVDRGNSHQEEAQAIGKAASSFIIEELKMDNVYDYMFHLLSEYAKLLKYKPTVPENAVELCSESMACSSHGLEKDYMTSSLVKGPSYSEPCRMPPPYDPATLHSVIERRKSTIKQVETWENQYWQTHNG